MENLIRNIAAGVTGENNLSGFNLARHMADEHEKKTGNRCHVRRMLDYVDEFNGRNREHWSFDIVEIS